MNCERIHDELALHPVVRSIGDLPIALRGHVATCGACERVVNERIALDRLLDHLPTIEPSANFDRELRLRLEEGPAAFDRTAPHRATSAARVRGPRRLAPLAAAAALLIVAFAMTQRTMESPSPRAPDDEMLAQLDLLMNWELLDRHSAELDLIGADDLLKAVESAEDGS